MLLGREILFTFCFQSERLDTLFRLLGRCDPLFRQFNRGDTFSRWARLTVTLAYEIGRGAFQHFAAKCPTFSHEFLFMFSVVIVRTANAPFLIVNLDLSKSCAVI